MNDDNTSLSEVLDTAFEQFSNNLNTSTGGVIESFDPTTMTASIKLANKKVYESLANRFDLVQEDVPTLIGVPVLYPGGGPGKVRITTPISKGDTCYIIFSQDDLNNFRSSAKAGSSPALLGKFSWSSSVCIPADIRNASYGANYYSNDSAVISAGGEVDFVALAEKVMSNLEALNSAISTHTHDVVVASGSSAGTYTAAPSGTTANLDSVASSKLKVE